MKNLSYYSFADSSVLSSLNNCSNASDAAPLIINCAGNFNTVIPFTTHNPTGRLDYYFMHVTSGRLKVELPTGTEWAKAGDTVIFPPEYPYTYTYEGGEELNYIWVHFTGSAASFYLEDMGYAPLPVIKRSISDNRALAKLHAMFERYSRDDRLRRHALAALFLQALTELSPAAGEGAENPIERSLRYIDSSYPEDIRIPRLAAMENLSNSRYYVIFKETVGRSPREYITELRMRHACELLRTTDISVKQIGALVGYSDPHFFSKLFKANVGVSPTEYRLG